MPKLRRRRRQQAHSLSVWAPLVVVLNAEAFGIFCVVLSPAAAAAAPVLGAAAAALKAADLWQFLRLGWPRPRAKACVMQPNCAMLTFLRTIRIIIATRSLVARIDNR